MFARKLREKFISQSLGEDITALKHYDAVFNNEHHSVRETAAAILAHRDANGPFRSVDDLLDVRGIGEAKLEQLRPLVRV